MVEAIKRDNRLLVDSFDHVHENTLVFKEKKFKLKSLCWEKHLNYFEGRDKELNETQKSMVQVISSLIKVMGMVLK
jgi:meiotically up-regulated gene 157 (Mug157) protein